MTANSGVTGKTIPQVIRLLTLARRYLAGLRDASAPFYGGDE